MWVLLFLAFTLVLAACGEGVPVAKPPPPVWQRGDSITQQAGQTLLGYLPAGTVLQNMGVPGSMARDVELPTYVKDAIYTYSFGVNECIGGVPPEEYRAALNHLVQKGIGFALVLEAPWRVTDPRCSNTIDLYRAVVVDLGRQYGVPVAIEDNQEHDGNGIHLTQAHMEVRAQVLARAISKL
jgi:hypothetical protein